MIPASTYEPGRTHCPSCHATQKALVDECPFCGFTAAHCVAKYPYSPPPLERFMDPDGRLSAGDRKVASKAINRLEKRLPQVRLYVCVARLEENVDPREFGYWLFNRSRPASKVDADHHRHGVLVMIDRSSRSASLTIGYGLDPFIDDVLLTRVFSAATEEFKIGRYGHGLARFGRRLLETLFERQELAVFARDKWKRLRGGGTGRSKPATSEKPEVVVARRDAVPLSKTASRKPGIPAARTAGKEEHASI